MSLLAPCEAGSKAALLHVRLMPHVQRAVDLHRRHSANRAPGLAARASLDVLPTAVWLLDANGALHHANLAAQRLTQCGTVIALDVHGQLHACAALDDRRLQQNDRRGAARGIAARCGCRYRLHDAG
ncbi:MAG: hypothetical protein ABL877_13475 [Thiobacillus sp.]